MTHNKKKYRTRNHKKRGETDLHWLTESRSKREEKNPNSNAFSYRRRVRRKNVSGEELA